MANEGRENNANWDGIWDVKTRIAERLVRGNLDPVSHAQVRDEEPQVWGINFERKLRRLNEDSYWSPLPRIYESGACLDGRHDRGMQRPAARARTSA